MYKLHLNGFSKSFLFGLALVFGLLGCQPINITPKSTANITAQFSSIVLDKQQMDMVQIATGDGDAFAIKPPPTYILGDGSKTYWYRTTLSAEQMQGDNYILEIPHPILDRVDVWFRQGEHTWHYQDGEFRPFNDKTIKDASLAFPVPAVKKALQVIIKVDSISPMTFSVWLWEKAAWEQHQKNTLLWYGVVFGGVAILVLYNLFLAVSFRDIRYLYYIGYVLSLLMINAVIAGVSSQYLWPDRPGMSSRTLLTVVALTSTFGVLFINEVLNIKAYYPVWRRISLIVMLLAVPLALPELFGFLNLGIANPILAGSVMFIANLGVIYYLFITIAVYRHGVKQARYFVMSFITFSIGYFIYYAYLLGIIVPNEWLAHLLELALLVEGLLLSFALADRVNVLAQEKAQIETQASDAQRYFAKRLITIQETEREAFSSVMHDTIGHGLLVLKQNLDAIGTTLPIQTEQLSEQSQHCRELLHEVRRVSHDLHPHLLKRLGLKVAIESTMERAFAHKEIEWHAEITNLPNTLEEMRQITIYRIVQECINNILKHAQATEVILVLQADEQNITVKIKDDGKGFDYQSHRNGLGLSAIQGRIDLFHGSLTVQSEAGKGCCICFSLPIK